ncbi:hypothetical protein PVAP13_1KG320000 [Panicum virgatum]|uniref:Uncharacterized protein n=1 Tax=Panicum virgatum TaxID=38727 RepID=A0A8T0XFM6_PANVG|nr:hypothetical protein PVAP13_1KG320000 [Panicum virgatum]
MAETCAAHATPDAAPRLQPSSPLPTVRAWGIHGGDDIGRHGGGLLRQPPSPPRIPHARRTRLRMLRRLPSPPRIPHARRTRLPPSPPLPIARARLARRGAREQQRRDDGGAAVARPSPPPPFPAAEALNYPSPPSPPLLFPTLPSARQVAASASSSGGSERHTSPLTPGSPDGGAAAAG